MKTYKVGLVLAAILMVVAGFGIGIAQAAGNQKEFVPEDNYSGTNWQVSGPIETGNMPEPSGADSAVVKAEGDMYQDAQLRQPIETGSLLARSYEDELDHSNVPIEGNSHQYWGNDNPSN